MSTPQTLPSQKPSPAAAYRDLVERLTLDLLRSMVGEERVKEAAGRFALAFRAAAMTTPGLYDVRPQSVAQAVALCALTGLMPGGPLPDCYLIPRKEKNPSTNQWDIPGLQWMISWRGMQKLVQRTGARIRAVPVWAGEDFSVVEGLEPDLRHVRDIDASGTWEALRAVYVVVRFPDGQVAWDVLGRKQIEARRDVSDSWKRYQAGKASDSPWATWPVEMALKTAIRYAISRGIAPIDETGMSAFERDGEDERRVVIDVPATAAPAIATPSAPPARALPDRSRLDELEQQFAPQAEPVRVDEPVPAVAAPTAEPARTRTPRKPKEQAAPPAQSAAASTGQPAGQVPQPPAPHDPVRAELIASAREGEDILGSESALQARDQAGIARHLRADDMTVDQLRALVGKLGEIAESADQQGN